ncbi:MAG: hypothetical protein K6F54_00340 [Lachnospiraceae bacterium]|nr:hypothetical protein [Lachnospiraceae bacterium]
MKKMNNIGKHGNSQIITEPRSVDIPCLDPHSTITVHRYTISESLRDLIDNFHEYCMEFLKSGNPDPENGSYMDQIIDKTVYESVSRVKADREDHKMLICLPLNDMHVGDYITTKKELEARIRKNELRKARLAEVDRVYNHGTAYEKSRGGE